MVLIDDAFAAADLGAVLDIQGETPLLQSADAGRSLVQQFSFGLWTAAGYNTAIRRWGFGGGVVVQQGWRHPEILPGPRSDPGHHGPGDAGLHPGRPGLCNLFLRLFAAPGAEAKRQRARDCCQGINHQRAGAN